MTRWSQIYAPLRTHQHPTAAPNEGVIDRQLAVFTEMIQRRFSWSSYYLRLNVIPANSFWVKCVRFSPCHDGDFSKRPGDFRSFRRISEDFRTLPKIKCPQMFPKTFEHFRSYLKDDNFSVLWYDFVRIQKRTQSHHVLRTICQDLWVRRDKLTLMRDIDAFSPQA